MGLYRCLRSSTASHGDGCSCASFQTKPFNLPGHSNPTTSADKSDNSRKEEGREREGEKEDEEGPLSPPPSPVRIPKCQACSEHSTCTSSLNLHRRPPKVASAIIPILQARRPRLKTVRYRSQRQPAGGRRSQGPHSRLRASLVSEAAAASASEAEQKGLYVGQRARGFSCEVGKSRQEAWFPSKGDSFPRVCPVAPHTPLGALGESSVVGASLPQLLVGSCWSPSPENGSPHPRLPRGGTNSVLRFRLQSCRGSGVPRAPILALSLRPALLPSVPFLRTPCPW